MRARRTTTLDPAQSQSAPSRDRAPTAQALVPACALTEEGFSRQRARYAHVAAAARTVRYDERRLRVEAELSLEVDEQVVEALVATERECCPFFDLTYDASARRLVVGVERAEHAAALEVVAAALRGRR